MSGIKGEVIWPRLVANKIFRKRIGGNNFVADFPTHDHNIDSYMEIPPCNFNHKSLTPNASFIDRDEETRNFKYLSIYLSICMVFVSTWNVGGVTPDDNFNMDELIDHMSNPCDIYVFGFQEVVPLRAGNVLGSEKSKISMKWNSLIRAALMKRETKLNKVMKEDCSGSSSFRCIISKQMVGILISVWVRAELCPFIRNPCVSCVGCGFCIGKISIT
ncbi:DNAse I-like superfamily protein [Perilla frutescens var. frutescens]|nr:DNAse I-like superfamily protein [Perilla frutescens var. frutescens]